ncbi:AraC family transcriptional regulator [Sutcliffiella deserti]|uniref:AraC family transcriptional regulator n=1 Tax=Sutcliffiella deserti TaxID=2875501 RepID=UPI001CBE45C0|nr:DUF6597 domain-containing transcriptional factor [Sutcliffiella deserti]
MIYQIKKPSIHLLPWIENYWQVQLHTGEFMKNETILPNGKIEMIFALEGNYKVGNRKTYSVKHSWLSGIQHEPLHIQYNGASNLIGIRFHPHGLFPFLPIPINETINQVEPLSLLLGELANEIYENLCESKSIAEVFNKLDRYLISRISSKKEKQHSVVQQGINYLKKHPTTSFSNLAFQLGYSDRHFNRIFKDQTGISPKLMARIFRFEQSCLRLFDQKELEGSSFVQELGYYDQSHFIKEFKRFSGMTPMEYQKVAKHSNNFI